MIAWSHLPETGIFLEVLRSESDELQVASRNTLEDASIVVGADEGGRAGVVVVCESARKRVERRTHSAHMLDDPNFAVFAFGSLTACWSFPSKPPTKSLKKSALNPRNVNLLPVPHEYSNDSPLAEAASTVSVVKFTCPERVFLSNPLGLECRKLPIREFRDSLPLPTFPALRPA